MKMFRNCEIRLEILLHIALTALLACIGEAARLSAITLVVSAGVLFGLLHFCFTRRRYRAIAKLSSAIDRILHGQEQILITGNDEGELSILQSEIQKMTLRLKESADALRADKLQLVDAIADISHQLRTPLTSMNLTVSLLAAEDLSEERRLSLTHDLRKSLRRIDWLIEALLKMSRIDAGAAHFKMEEVAVKQLVGKVVEPLAITMELKEIALLCSVGNETFTGDMAWSVEALGNVVKNCVEHSLPGGWIEISAAETALYTEIVVRDNGEGFEPSDLPHLFDRFYKGKGASADSIGIGLALARMVIAQQNGTIQAVNGKDGGAQFNIRFYKSVV